MKPPGQFTFFERWLGWLAGAVFRRPRWFLYPQGLLFLASLWYTVQYLEFNASRDSLVGPNKKYHQNFLRYKKEFPKQDDLVVVVESEDRERNRQFVERLGLKLEAETNLFRGVFYKGDLKMLGAKALMFISDKSPPSLSAADLRNLPSLAERLNRPADPVSQYLHGRLSDATRNALADYLGSAGEPKDLLPALTNDLNRILTGPLIYEPQRFEGVALRAETQKLLAEQPMGGKLAQLNRRLLEDAYPLELARSDLEELLRKLREYRPFIEQFTRATNLISFFDMVNTQIRTTKRERSAETDALIMALPALERIIQQATASLRRPGVPPSPGITALFNAGQEAEQASYITFNSGQIYLVTAHAADVTLNGPAIERLRVLMEETRREVPGLNVGLTGEPVLEHDEMLQSQKDTTLASLVALALCALIFVYGYQESGRPVKATLCLVVGLAYTLAFATATVGHLNILTITFVPMLIGLAIDFGVHLVTRYEEELRNGLSEEAALTTAMVFTGKGIFTGALTTAGAFFAMTLTNFKGIQEMGVICAGGLVICLVPMMTLLPALLLRGRQNVLDHQLGDQLHLRARIEGLWLRRPVFVGLMTLLFCGISAYFFTRVYFDYNLLNMQSAGLPAVHFEKKLINATNVTPRSVLFGVVLADSPSKAMELEERLKALPAVAGVDSITSYLQEDQTSKLALIGEIKEQLAPLEFRPPDARPVNVPELSRTLYSLHGYLGNALEEVKPEEDAALRRQLVSLRQAINELRKEMLRDAKARFDSSPVKLAAFQRALFNDVRDTFDALRHQDNRTPLRVEDLPEALRDRFVGVTGKYLLQVYPRKDLWQRPNQKEFIQQVRTVDPNVTGTPVQLYEYTTLLKNSYEEAALYALGAIVILVLLHFRSPFSVVLALLPVGIGTLWLVGLMGLCNIPFNPANIMTLPLVIGIGVTNGIHILNRFAEERHPSILAKSTGKAVLVSGLTTIAGFGSLVLAKHQGIESLGYVMATGVLTCMIAGLTVLPAFLNLLSQRGKLKKQPSADNAQPTLGQEEPR